MTTVPILLGFNGSNYQVTRSLRFRSSASAYLNRTPASAGNRKTWTWSGWIKLGALTSGFSFMDQYSDANNQSQARIRADGVLRFYDLTSNVFTTDIYWTPVYRDPSAWYHIMLVADTSQATNTNRVKFYVNGTQVTSTSSATWPSQNTDLRINLNAQHFIGQNGAGGEYADGYLAEVNFIDGQALTPSSFGYFDLYGVWQPKKYNGTFGTNGFYLPFSNTTSTTTLTADSSGNGNNWTANNISLTAGTTYDSMIDSPTNYADGGNGRGNYAVMNPLVATASTMSNANLTVTGQGATAYFSSSTFPFGPTGKWYCEVICGSVGGPYNPHQFGLGPNTRNTSTSLNIYLNNYGQVGNQNVISLPSGSYTDIQTSGLNYTQANGDIIQFAYDADTGKSWIGINNSWVGTSLTAYNGAPSTGTNPTYTFTANTLLWLFTAPYGSGTAASFNFGQRPFNYTPPTGFQALNTQNLPPSAVPYGAPYMNAITYTGYGPLVPSGLGILTKRNASTQNVSKSLRFRASASAYLNRTFGTPTNNKIWTYSFWTKRGLISNSTRLSVLGSNNTGNNSANFEFASETGSSWTNGDNFAYGEWTTGWQTRVTTLAVFRDPSAWYHIVIAYDSTQATASNRVKIYVNGSLQTVNSSSLYPTQNVASTMNVNAVSYAIGSAGTTTQPYDGYIAEAVFVDGQQLTPSSFGQTNSDGIWVPKAYTGTYGTNGFYLPFTNTTSTTTLGNDSSGNGNNFTVNNISLTAGTTYDSMIDSPTDYASAGDYATLNPLTAPANVTVADANLSWAQTTTSANRSSMATFGMSSGKWYWEFSVGSSIGGNNSVYPGIAQTTFAATLTNYCGGTADSWSYTQGNGYKVTNGSGSAYGATYTSNDVIGIAFDADVGSLTFYKNGVSQGVAFTGLTSGPYFPVVSESIGSAGGTTGLKRFMNFGQQPFVYAAPSGYSTLNTYNITAPSTTWFSSANNSGNASATAYPDFVWIKSRSSAQNHSLNDTLRGPTLNLVSNSTAAEAGASTMFAVNKYGLTLGNDASVNSSSYTDVMWGWQGGNGTTSTNTSGTITSTVSASTTSGVSILTYTGTGANATVGHGLGVAPSYIIVKKRGSGGAGTYGWYQYHVGLTSAAYSILFDTAAQSNTTTMWNSTAPTASVFSVGTSNGSNESSQNYVAYCFAAIRGFSAFGSYTGNGSTDGPFVYTGFKPRWIIMKCSTTAGLDWNIVDTSRNLYNVTTSRLWADLSNAEDSTDNVCDILSNGFKLRSTNTNTNASGATFIYAAFAENPFNMSRAR